MKRCTNPECGHVEGMLEAKYCAICGSGLVDVVGPGGQVKPGEMAYEVYLISPGERIINSIKVVRQYTSLGLKEAKELVESAPRAVCTGVAGDVAEDMKRAFEDIGARAQIRVIGAVGRIPEDSDSEFGYVVILNDSGSEKIEVIKVVRQYTTLGLKEAKDLVESVPRLVCAGLTKEAAERLERELEAVGAAAEVRSGYSGYDRRQQGSLTPATAATADTHPPIRRAFQSTPIEPGKGRVNFRSCFGCLMPLLVLLVMIITLV